MLLAGLIYLFIGFVEPFPTLGLNLAQDFFVWKNVGNINIFTCSQYDAFKIMSHLMKINNHRVQVGSGWTALSDRGFYSMMKVRYTKLGVLLDYNCDFTKRILNQGSDLKMLNDSYSWLIWSTDSEVLNKLTKLNLGLTSDVVLAIGDPAHSQAILYDMHKVNYSSTLETEIAAKWSTAQRLNLLLNKTKIRMRRDFKGLKLRGTVVLTKLETNSSNAEDRILDTSLLPHLDSVSRFTYVLFLYLQDLYNFTFSFEVSESWGYVMPDGGHDGMVGQLERGEIELGLTPATMFKHRMDTVDFTASVWKFRTCFIFRHPKSFGIYKALVMPFSPAVWVCTGALCILIVSALRLIHRFEVTDWPDTELSWSASTVLVIGAISQQGFWVMNPIELVKSFLVSIQPKSTPLRVHCSPFSNFWDFLIRLASMSYRVSVRILSLFVLVLSVVLYAFYGAAIVTSLLTPPAKSIRSIRQLLDSPVTMGVENTAYTRDYFSKSEDPLTAELYRRRLQTSTGFMAVPEGIERMRTKSYAFYAEDATLYLPIEKTFSNSEKCDLSEVELFSPYLVSTPVQKMSPFRDFVSCGFNLMRERGILNRENQVWHPHRPQCFDERKVARVEMESVMLAFAILAGGIVGSLMILVSERTFFKIRKQKSKKK